MGVVRARLFCCNYKNTLETDTCKGRSRTRGNQQFAKTHERVRVARLTQQQSNTSRRLSCELCVTQVLITRNENLSSAAHAVI
jgi:hypothetical protein